MAEAFPGGDVRLWAAEEARLRARTRLLRLGYPALDAAAVRRAVRIEGGELLDRSLAGGRGVVLVAAHFGVHALPPLSLRLLGWPVTAVRVMLPGAALGPDRAWSQERRRALEDGLPLPYLDAGRSPAPALAVLARGEALAVGGDGSSVSAVTGCRDRLAPIAGRQRPWPALPFELAEAAGAALLGLFFESRPPGHRLALRALDGPDPQRSYIAHYRDWLARYPDQWQLWLDQGGDSARSSSAS